MSYLEDEFCDIIGKAMAGLGLNTKAIASKTGIQEACLSPIETGKRPPSQEEAKAIAEALRLGWAELWEIAIDRWRPAPPPPDLKEKVIIIKGSMGGYEVRAYLYFDRDTKDAILIDTALNPGAVINELNNRGLKIRAILLTHRHSDHTGGIEPLIDSFPVEVFSRDLISPTLKARGRAVRDGEMCKFGSLSIRCMETPGHTPCSFCYYSEGICFVGDTLFAGSIGRSNPPSMYDTHLRSIREKILTLPDDTIILPGHGPLTTVGEEKEHNPFL